MSSLCGFPQGYGARHRASSMEGEDDDLRMVREEDEKSGRRQQGLISNMKELNRLGMCVCDYGWDCVNIDFN